MRVKLALVLILLAAGLFAGWIFTHPSEATCAASGRIVDLTHRYCLTETGSVTLREHMLRHATDPIILLPAILVAALVLLVAAKLDRRKR